MTKLSELQPGQGSVNIEVTVKSIEEPKVFNKYGKDLKVANAMITDGESEMKLTLWNDDIDKVKVGSIIKIENGYVNEFQGEKQLTTGKFGKLEIAGEGETPNETKTEEAPKETGTPEESSDSSDFSSEESSEDY
jgi:replication factor A1